MKTEHCYLFDKWLEIWALHPYFWTDQIRSITQTYGTILHWFVAMVTLLCICLACRWRSSLADLFRKVLLVNCFCLVIAVRALYWLLINPRLFKMDSDRSLLRGSNWLRRKKKWNVKWWLKSWCQYRMSWLKMIIKITVLFIYLFILWGAFHV